jgi:hypothetical protein
MHIGRMVASVLTAGTVLMMAGGPARASLNIIVCNAVYRGCMNNCRSDGCRTDCEIELQACVTAKPNSVQGSRNGDPPNKYRPPGLTKPPSHSPNLGSSNGGSNLNCSQDPKACKLMMKRH